MKKGALMGSRKPLPQTAQERGLLARLAIGLFGASGQTIAKPRRAPALEKPAMEWTLMGSVSAGGVALSVILAGVGVAGIVGAESTLAKIGSAVLVLGTLLTEAAAARLPIHCQRRFCEGAWVKGTLALLGFGALTAWNLVAAHMGMMAIDHAALQDRRAPLERAAAEADAARETAEEALAAFDAESRQQSEAMGWALRGAFESGYVTSAARNARESADARALRREGLARDVSQARAADRAAEAALEAAPRGRPEHELFGFAIVLELLKGALVWFATAGERRARLDAKGTPASNFVLQCNTKSDPRTLSPAERRELKSRCASILATIRHMEAARAY